MENIEYRAKARVLYIQIAAINLSADWTSRASLYALPWTYQRTRVAAGTDELLRRTSVGIHGTLNPLRALADHPRRGYLSRRRATLNLYLDRRRELSFHGARCLYGRFHVQRICLALRGLLHARLLLLRLSLSQLLRIALQLSHCCIGGDWR